VVQAAEDGPSDDSSARWRFPSERRLAEAPWATASNERPNLQSLSRIRNLGAWPGGVRLRSCCASQFDVGSVVDVVSSSRRVSKCMTTKT
jgi:hypothetical protein